MWLHKLLLDLLDHETDSMMITRVVCKSLWEPNVSWWIETRWDEISLYQRYDAEKNSTHAVPSYTWEDCRHLHQINLVKNTSLVERECWWLQPIQISKVHPYESWHDEECLPSWEGVLMIATTRDILQDTNLREIPWEGCVVPIWDRDGT